MAYTELCIKKKIETNNGLFRIGAVILNVDETWKDDNIKPICADDDFMISFIPKGTRGSYPGKKHFHSILEAEIYIRLLNINGFSTTDL